MIYQFHGKYGPFTLEAFDDLLVLALQYKFATDNSVYVKTPTLLSENFDAVTYKIELQKKFPNDIGEFVDANLSNLLTALDSIITGHMPERQSFNNDVLEISNDPEMPEEDRIETLKMLKAAYRSQNDLYQDLSTRIQQVESLIKFRQKELEKFIIEDLVDETEDGPDEDNGI